MALRQELLATLEAYEHTWETKTSSSPWSHPDEAVVSRFISFVTSTPGCFHRTTLAGHMTGSALVVNSSLTKVLLTHHKKLGMWLQLGGHADGHHKIHEVAMTEAHEESGLTNLSFMNYERDIFGASTPVPLPFDLDCHLIPMNAKDPEHYHYDVRYVVMAASEVLPIVSEESHDVRWFTIEAARTVTQERSMHRQFDKIEWLKNKLRIPLTPA
jgi:ADP-ribose pyrophosphatase YjhB (NUDIX family)